MSNEIKKGDRVRSFDFANGEYGRDLEGERACYVEGTVIDLPTMAECKRYHIVVERRIFGGKEILDGEDSVFPPINGTRSWLGRLMDCVELIT